MAKRTKNEYLSIFDFTGNLFYCLITLFQGFTLNENYFNIYSVHSVSF